MNDNQAKINSFLNSMDKAPSDQFTAAKPSLIRRDISMLAVFSENIGWHNTLLVWLLIALLGTAICVACVKLWKAKMSINNC